MTVVPVSTCPARPGAWKRGGRGQRGDGVRGRIADDRAAIRDEQDRDAGGLDLLLRLFHELLEGLAGLSTLAALAEGAQRVIVGVLTPGLGSQQLQWKPLSSLAGVGHRELGQRAQGGVAVQIAQGDPEGTSDGHQGDQGEDQAGPRRRGPRGTS